MSQIETKRLLLRPWRDTDYLTTNPASGCILERVGFLDQGDSTCHSTGSGLTGLSRRMVLTKTRFLEQKAQDR